MLSPSIRALTTTDLGAYVALRREMLADAPWAFSASVEDDVGVDQQLLAARLAQPGQAIVGAFDEHQRHLVGAAGLHRDRHVKLSHRAHIWGVYVTPAARGAGLAARIVAAALDVARTWAGVDSAGLSVSENSPAAQRVYRSLGFVPWGTEPDFLRVGGRSYAEIHMMRAL